MSIIRDDWGVVKYIETEEEVRELALERMLENKEPVYVYDYAAADFVPATEAEAVRFGASLTPRVGMNTF